MVIALFRHDFVCFSETVKTIYTSYPIGGDIVSRPIYEHIVNITINSETEGVLNYHEQLLVHATTPLAL